MLDYHKTIPNLSRKEFLLSLEKVVESPYFEKYQIRGDNYIQGVVFNLDLRGKAIQSRMYNFPSLGEVSKLLIGSFDHLKNEEGLDIRVNLVLYPSSELHEKIGLKPSDLDEVDFPLNIQTDNMIRSHSKGLALTFQNFGLKDCWTNKRHISALKTLHRQLGQHLGRLFPGKLEDSSEVYKKLGIFK